MAELTAPPLTAEAFAPYGQVLMARGEGPQRDEYATTVTNLRDDAKANMTFIRADPKPPVIMAVERHLYSTQIFVPMNGVRYLVGVCPSRLDGGPDLEGLVAFVANGGQTVNYDAGVWHSPLCVLDRPGEFTMLRWDDGGDADTELLPLDQPVNVHTG